MIYPEKEYITGNCEVISLKQEKEYYNRYTVKIKNINNIENSKNTKIIIYAKKEYEIKVGDILKFSGEFSKGSESRNYRGFNYRTYLKQSKIHGIVMIDNLQIEDNKVSIYSIIGNIKNSLYDQIDNFYEKDNADFLKSMLLGDTSSLSDDIKIEFRDSNILHILAISGTHTVYVIFAVKFILERFINSKKVKNYILIIILIFFAVLTGMSASCIVACIMSGISILSSNLQRKSNYYRSIIVTFFIIVVFNPYNLQNVGMWLSIMGSLGLITFHKFLKRLLEYYIRTKRLKDKKPILYLIQNKICEIVLLSISAQILVTPIIAFVFSTVSFTFFISNLLIHYLVGPILAIGYLSIFIGMISPYFGEFLSFFESILIQIIIFVARICSKIPFSKVYIKTPSILSVTFYYIFIMVLVYYFKNNKFKILKLILNKRNLVFFIKQFYISNKNKLIKFVSIILIIIFILNIYNLIPKELRIYFIDVGQGDSTLIITPTNKTILIDGGEGNSDKYDQGENVVLPYLLARGITKVNYLIASHCDSDHIGGLFAIIGNLKVDKILIGKQGEDSKQLQNLIDIANEKDVEIIVLESDSKFNVDKYIYLDILWPEEQNLIRENSLNNNSLLLKLTYGEFSCLFTGDIEEIAENIIVKKYENSNILNSTILKVAHHRF